MRWDNRTMDKRRSVLVVEKIREHAGIADLPVDEIIAVADTVVVRPDPQPAWA